MDKPILVLRVSGGVFSGCGGVSRKLKFYIKSLYVMGKALLGNLSCTGTGLAIVFCRRNMGHL